MTRPFANILRSARCVALAVALLPLAAKAEPTKLKFAFFASDREFAFRGVVKPFADAVNSAANGAVEIELHPGGALERSYAQQAQLVLSGGADFAWLHPALTPELFPDNGVIELPGLFRDAQEATGVFTEVVASGRLRGYDAFVVIGAMASAPIAIHARPPVASLADLRTKKIRSGNRTEGVVLKALGMEPESLPINQTADAINRGAIDGATAGLEVLADFGISRFATNHYMLGLGSVPLLIVMNRKKFNQLPVPVQSIIRAHSGKWIASRYVATVNAYNAEILERLKADGRRRVTTPSTADLDHARSTFTSVIDRWKADNSHGQQLLTVAEAEIAKLRATR
jgi:TRAP-type C4-dicarboxylate transport system substrate-binding protein